MDTAAERMVSEMSGELTQIPKSILKRFLEFLNENRTGQITFDVHRGAVNGMEVREKVRGEKEDEKIKT